MIRKTIFKTILMGLLLISLLPLFVISLINYQHTHKFLIENAEEKLMLVADAKTNQIQSFFQGSLSALLVQARLKSTTVLLKKLRLAFEANGLNSLGHDDPQWTNIIEHYEEDIGFFLSSHNFYDYIIIDFEGNILFTDRQDSDLGKNVFKGRVANSLFAKACQKAYKNELPIFSGYENYTPYGNLPAGFLVTLIFDENGKKAGVAGVSFKPSAIDRIIQSNVGLGHQDEVSLIDENLLLIASSRKINKSILFTPVPSEQALLWQKDHMAHTSPLINQEQSLIYTNRNGTRVMGLYKNIDFAGSSMAVVTELSVAEALKNENRQKNTAIFTLSITILFVIFLAIKIAGHITRPIIKLSAITKKIAAGDLDQKIDIDSDNEIGELANDFNRMIAIRKQADKSLIESRKKIQEESDNFNNVFHNNYNAVSIIDGNKFIDCNDALVKMLNAKDKNMILNIHPSELSPEKQPDGRSSFEKANHMIEKAFETGFSNFEWMHKKITGEEFPVDVSLTKINFKGQPVLHCLWKDLSKEKAMIESLYKAKRDAEAGAKAKSEFLANMSHEIRTPMNGVVGMGALLLDTELNEEQRDYLKNINTSAEALLDIINAILDFSKIEAGKFDLEIIEFDLRTTIENITDTLAIAAGEKTLELACLIQHDVPTALRGDPGRLRQIIMNIAGNAMKFTTTGEVSIHVLLEKEEKREVKIRFEVVDTGIGISRKNIEKLFESFSQADTSTTRKYGGTGLGLTISKSLVQMMKGEIGVLSKENKGSTFWFTAVFEKQKKIKEKIIFKDIAGKHILIVDDVKINRRVLKEQLKPVGCYVETAMDGSGAIEKLHAAFEQGNPFDIAILDMQMPKMDGETLGKTIKESKKIKNTILIMLTSIGTRGDAARIKKSGFAGYLNKPVKQARLFDCLRMALGSNTLDTGSTNRDEIMPDMITKHTIAENRQDKLFILLVEDNKINQKVATAILKKMNHSIVVANNGKEGVEAFKKNRYDLILMDIQMPVMDGLSATAEIRQIEKEKGSQPIPIIALTAHAMKGDREKYLAAGMDDYMTKPVKKEIFIKIFTSVMG